MAIDPDLILLQHCLAGVSGAWEAFVDRFAPPLAEACRRTLRRSARPSGPQEVADMLQEVFLHFLIRDMQVLRDYQGRARVEAFLCAVAVCRVLNDRVLKKRPQLTLESLQASPPVAPGPAFRYL